MALVEVEVLALFVVEPFADFPAAGWRPDALVFFADFADVLDFALDFADFALDFGADVFVDRGGMRAPGAGWRGERLTSITRVSFQP